MSEKKNERKNERKKKETKEGRKSKNKGKKQTQTNIFRHGDRHSETALREQKILKKR